MRAVILGGGKSGNAAAELLRREGVETVLLDGAAAFPDGAADLCVVSPGIALEHEWQVTARARGLKIVSELQLGAERWVARGGRLLAVTGSKGKSSVVKLVAETLEGVPCGNYGKPLCEVVNDLDGKSAAGKWAVAEVSSFQMETTNLPCGTFEAAAILNLQDDHLDRHGNRETYHALKRKLLTQAKVGIDGSQLADASERDAALIRGSYFDNAVLRKNGAVAIALMRSAGVSDERIAAGLRMFAALPHRFERVRGASGPIWVDDSKATSLAALQAGVEMAFELVKSRGSGGKVYLIAGGKPKGDDPFSVKKCLQSKVQKVYLIGYCAKGLSESWSPEVPCEVCGTLENAVKMARCEAGEGDCVLLSPGTASFDQFKSYAERGEKFSAYAKEGKKE